MFVSHPQIREQTMKTSLVSRKPAQFSSEIDHEQKLVAFMKKLHQADAIFKKSQHLYLTKILENKKDSHYNHQSYIRFFQFDFLTLANQIENEYQTIKKDIERKKKMGQNPSTAHLFKLCAEILKKHGFENAALKTEFHENELISFFIRFDAWAGKWINVEKESRCYSKVNFNDLQSAKTMEMILFFLASPVMMHMATGCSELHDCSIIPLNFKTHESQANLELRRLNILLRKAKIVFKHGKINHEMSIDEYDSLIEEKLKNVEKKNKRNFDLIEKFLLLKSVVRRCKNKLFEKDLTDYINLCHKAQICFTMAYDESQNATNNESTMHRQIKKVWQRFENFANTTVGAKNMTRREYWSATTAQHNGTGSSICYGVVGDNHTGVHCIEGKYLKNISGLYLNDPKCPNHNPDVKSLTVLLAKLSISSTFWHEKSYNNESYFNEKRNLLLQNNVIPSSITTHEDYLDYVHENFARLIEFLEKTNKKTPHHYNMIDSRNPMIAIRAARSNEVSMKLIAGIMEHLDDKKYHIRTFNKDTVVDGKNIKAKKKFSLKTWLTKEYINSPHNKKSLVLFFTGMGRCGDRFPRDFRTFVDMSRGKDATILLQGFFGRSCGYFKDRPWVLLFSDQARIIQSYIANHGHAPSNSTQKGTKKSNRFNSKSFFVSEYPCLNAVAEKLMRLLHSTAIKRNLQGRNNCNSIPREYFDEIIKTLVDKGEKLCTLDKKNFYFENSKNKTPFPMSYEVENGEVKIRNRSGTTDRISGSDISGGIVSGIQKKVGYQSHNTNGIFVPSIVWHKTNSSRIKLKIVGFSLLCAGSHEKINGNIVKIPSRVCDPEQSAFHDIDFAKTVNIVATTTKTTSKKPR